MLTMKRIFQMHTKKKMNKKLYYKRKKLLNYLSNVKNQKLFALVGKFLNSIIIGN